MDDNVPATVTYEAIAQALQPGADGLPPFTTVHMSVSLPGGVDLWERQPTNVPSTEERIISMAQRFINALRVAEGKQEIVLMYTPVASSVPQQA